MDILLNLGNTHARFVAATGTAALGTATKLPNDEDLTAALIREWQGWSPPDRLVGVNVSGPQGWQRVAAAAAELDWPVPQPLAPRQGLSGVQVAYPEVGALGADRWASLLAAHSTYPGATLVVDAGTALSLDLLEADGRHQGGWLCPGLTALRTSLRTNAPVLADVGASDPGDGPATDTAAAITTGTRLGYCGMADHLMQRLAAYAESPVTVVYTGGDAPLLARSLDVAHQLDAELVLRGVALALALGEAA